MKKFGKIFVIVLIAMVVVTALGAFAAFSDIETSPANTFTAGTLDLKLNGGDNPVSYTFSNMAPGSQPHLSFTLQNAGSIAGYLDLEAISVTSDDNGCNEPESSAGDVSCGDGEGELDTTVGLTLFHDADCSGWVSAGDTTFFDGQPAMVSASYPAGISMPPGGSTCVVAIVNWWDTASDNLAQGDDMILSMNFELGQRADQ